MKAIKNLWHKICPAYKLSRGKGGTKLEGMANQRLALLETHPKGEKQFLTPLMKLCYACRQGYFLIIH